MSFNRSLLLLVMMFTGLFDTVAQDCTLRLSGRVTDKATGETLEFTTIGIPEQNLGGMADSAGVFEFSNVCPGDFHLQLNHIGCPPAELFLHLTRDTMLQIQLEHHAELLREIKVEGSGQVLHESQAQSTINAGTIRAGAGKSLSELTANITGVHMISTGAGISKPVIHGLFGNRIALVNNGMLQGGQQWGADHAPEMDPNAAGEIKVVKGSDAIEYGSQAIGGAIVMEAGAIPRDPHLHGYAGYVFDVNGYGHSLLAKVSQSHKKFDWRLAGSYHRSGDTWTPDYFLTNTGVEEGSASIQTMYRPSEKVSHQLYYSLFASQAGIFSGAHISNLTDLETAIGSEVPFNIDDHFSYQINPPRQTVVHHLLSYSGKKFYSANTFLSWKYGVQYDHRKEFDIRRGNRSDIPALDLGLWTQSGELKWENFSNPLSFKAGIQGKWGVNHNSFETGILPLIPDYHEAVGSAFITVQRPVHQVTLEGGLRYDLHYLKAWPITTALPHEINVQEHTYHEFAASAGFLFKPSDRFVSRLNAGFARRAPAPNELYSNGLHQGVAGIEQGNWDLVPENSLKLILDQSIKVDHWLHIDADFYSHWINDYIYLEPEPELRLTIRGAFPVYQYKQANAWIRGFDLICVSDFSHQFEWTGKFSMVRGTVKADEPNLTTIPPLSLGNSFSWIFRDGSKRIGSKITLEGDYTARQDHWAPEVEFLEPPDAYFLVHAGVESGFRQGEHQWYLSFRVENIFNTKYREYLDRLRYYSDERGRTLRVQIRYEF